MIICRTPFRISFFGGGTDFPDWYTNNGKGLVISSTINKHCFLILRRLPPIFDYKYRLRYFRNEFVKNIKDIKHKSIKAVLENYHSSNTELELVHNADLPALSGLGASSAFTVSLINSINRLYNKKKISKYDLASKAVDIEQNVLSEHVGSQDQFSCSYGGLNLIKFKKEKINVKKINMSKENISKLENSLVLFYTGIQRKAQTIEKHKILSVNKNEKNLNEIYNLTQEAYKIFTNKNFDIKYLSELMRESWNFKKLLSKKVSNSVIDELYEQGIKNGALSGKILGAGGGGFMMFLVPNSRVKNKLIKNLKNFTSVNIKFESEGSKIIHESENDLF